MTGTPETIKQLVEGYDFEPPGRMIADLTAEQATVRREGWPYSIAGLVAHALYWQDIWLDGIAGRPNKHKRGSKADWPHVAEEEWESVRDRFLAGMEVARQKADDTGALSRKLDYGMTVEQIPTLPPQRAANPLCCLVY